MWRLERCIFRDAMPHTVCPDGDNGLHESDTNKMIIDCISDLHGYYPPLEGGDLLIVAGDLTARDTEFQHAQFAYWLEEQDYLKKIVIAGNHDGLLQNVGKQWVENMFPDATYLQDSGTEFCGPDKHGKSCTMKIWGSPWTPTFCDWSFMKDRGEPIRQMWDMIPQDTDILVTHGPPYGILDQVKYSSKAKEGKSAGCEELRTAVERIRPRLHVFGHVHEGYGQTLLKCTPTDVICVNASIMNEDYKPVNKPIRIEL